VGLWLNIDSLEENLNKWKDHRRQKENSLVKWESTKKKKQPEKGCFKKENL